MKTHTPSNDTPDNSPSGRGILQFRKFKKSNSGAAAVEFALVSIPFFVLLFSMLEQGLHFLSHRLIDAGVDSIARQVKTGQITGGNTSEAEFKAALCANPLMILFDCGKLSVDVQQLAQFQDPGSPPVNPDGSLDTSGFGFNPGGAQTINIIRAYYDWPTVLDWGRLANLNLHGSHNSWANVGDGMGTLGYRRIVGVAAFLSEPY